MTTDTGLTEKDMLLIVNAFQSISEIDKAILIGSRAMGNYKKGSDVDIAISGEKITWDIACMLRNMLNNELPLPYFFDVVDHNNLKHQDMKNHIEHHGIVIYKQK